MWYRLQIKDTKWEIYREIHSTSTSELTAAWYSFASYFLNKDWLEVMKKLYGDKLPPDAIVEAVIKPPNQALEIIINDCREEIIRYANLASRLESLLED
jgi:hypothetical protein